MKMTRCSGLWKNISGKADMVGKLVDTLHPDAVIQFCHWGCKQSSGGSLLLKEKLNEMNIPMLILDGDGIDRRNSHDGQIKTRLEAFLEMLENENGTEADGEKSSAGRLTEEEQERAC